MVENDFEANEQRRPRAPRQESDDEAVNSNVGDPVDDNIDHPPDLEKDKDETNDDDKEIVIPPDPAHEAKMAALHAENAQDRVLEKMQHCIPEIQEATKQRREELHHKKQCYWFGWSAQEFISSTVLFPSILYSGMQIGNIHLYAT